MRSAGARLSRYRGRLRVERRRDLHKCGPCRADARQGAALTGLAHLHRRRPRRRQQRGGEPPRSAVTPHGSLSRAMNHRKRFPATRDDAIRSASSTLAKNNRRRSSARRYAAITATNKQHSVTERASFMKRSASAHLVAAFPAPETACTYPASEGGHVFRDLGENDRRFATDLMIRCLSPSDLLPPTEN